MQSNHSIRAFLLVLALVVLVVLFERYRYGHPPLQCYFDGGTFSVITGWSCQ
jgi:hypothetical protein